jgi:hypothetical protein
VTSAFVYNKFLKASPDLVSESTLMRKLADTICKSGGLDSPIINKCRLFIAGVAYEIGDTVGTIFRSFVYGFLNKHEESIKDAAVIADKTITKEWPKWLKWMKRS